MFNNGLLSFLANTLCTELTLSQPDVKPLKTLYLNLVTKRWLLTRQAISFASSHQPNEKKNLNIHHIFWQALDTNSRIFRYNLLVFFPFIVICVVNKYNEPHGCRKILGETFIQCPLKQHVKNHLHDTLLFELEQFHVARYCSIYINNILHIMV